MELLTILAILLSPLITLQIQERLQEGRERRQRRINIFKTLMATRAQRVSADHVLALNMIDLEFSERPLTEAWKLYFDHLHQKVDDKNLHVWTDKGDDLFADLLYEMSKVLGYAFDKVHLKKGIYRPLAHGDEEIINKSLRFNLIKVLSGQQELKMNVSSLPVSEEALARQTMVQQQLIDVLKGKQRLRVQVDLDSLNSTRKAEV